MKKEIIYYRESALQSIASDLGTFAFLALLFAFNHYYLNDSKVAAFFFFVVFLIFALGKASTKGKRFTDKQKLINFINSQE